MPKMIRCPVCRNETTWENNQHRPFCSQRCQLLDLGKWADNSYTIENPDYSATEDEIEENVRDENIKY
jgi:endogenous inhibitor of DNA gyrase (YacG/DUF329 family)